MNRMKEESVSKVVREREERERYLSDEKET